MAAILAVIIIVYIIITIKRKNNSKTETVKSNNSGTTGAYTNSVIPTNTTQNEVFPLKRGSNHEAVKYLKQALNYIAKKRGITDVNLVLTTDANVFGVVTESALYRLYNTKICSKDLAKKIAVDADMPEVALLINNFQ